MIVRHAKGQAMTTASDTATNTDQIRALIQDRVRAIDEKDVEALVAKAAPGIISFDALPPLQRVGSKAIRTRLQEWFGGYDGPIGYEVRDLHITAGDDIAFAHYLYHVTGRMTNGNSVPFDAESGKASLDLTP
jgi:ketosteroid isomerase-like protein